MDIYNLSSRELGLLIYLAQNRAIDKEIEVTTTQIAEFFSISQQTASRCLLKLKEEAEDELRRDIDGHGLNAFPLVAVVANLHIDVQILNWKKRQKRRQRLQQKQRKRPARRKSLA